MTQRGDLFKGRQKKVQPVNSHGKALHIRKGKMVKVPLKKTKEMELNKELTKFINQANEAKAATIACKEGAQLCMVKSTSEVTGGSKKK